MYSLWHFNLWVIDSIACRAVIFQFIAFSSSLSNLDSSFARLQPVCSNQEVSGPSPFWSQVLYSTETRKFKALARHIAFLEESGEGLLGAPPITSQQPCSANTVAISTLGVAEGLCLGFAGSEPSSDSVTHTFTVKPWDSYLTPLRLSFLISKMKRTTITPT